MDTVIATTVIHRATKPGVRGDKSKGIPATKPEVQIIRPGARFQPKDQAEYDELMKSGAIKLPDQPAATMAEVEADAAAADAPKRKTGGKGGAKKAASTDDDNLV